MSKPDDSLPDAIRAAIAKRAGGVLSQRMAWERAAALARSQGLAPVEIATCIQSFAHARSLDALCRQAARAEEPLSETLGNAQLRADESDFSLGDWLAALEPVLLHLEREGRQAKPSVILGYIQCSADAAAATEPRPALAEIVAEMIEQYGFDG